jgi:hypothetical protein
LDNIQVSRMAQLIAFFPLILWRSLMDGGAKRIQDW